MARVVHFPTGKPGAAHAAPYPGASGGSYVLEVTYQRATDRENYA